MKPMRENSKKNTVWMPPSITEQEALRMLKDHFLGEAWYQVDPLAQGQINAIIVDEIKKLYPRPKWPKIWKARKMRGGA